MLKKFGFPLFVFLLLPCALVSQSTHSAIGPGKSLVVGGQISTFNPDWGCKSDSPFSCGDHQLLGVGVFADANHLVYRFGVEGEARWLHWRGPGNGLVQSNYLIGPRYPLLYRGKFSVHAKFLLGGSWMTFPFGVGSGSYFTMAPGITAEYRATRHIIVRGDYEYQFWPSYSGIAIEGNNGLTPNGFSAGVGYAF